MTIGKKGPIWSIALSTRAAKQKKDLPEEVDELLVALIGDMEESGPFQREWPKYSPLHKDKRIPANAHHCHLKRGHPTYVACWQVVNKTIRIIEIFYVGTHEKAPY
jgi:hypothetical protein